jgi:hypothetical protein
MVSTGGGHFSLVKWQNHFDYEFRPLQSRAGGSQKKVSACGGLLVGSSEGGLPHASAIPRSPAPFLAGGSEVLGGGLEGFLGLGVLDFVKVHNYHFLSFCTLIVSHLLDFVKHYLLISLKLFLIS